MRLLVKLVLGKVLSEEEIHRHRKGFHYDTGFLLEKEKNCWMGKTWKTAQFKSKKLVKITQAQL